MQSTWINKPKPHKNTVQKLSEVLNINEFLASLIAQRDIKTFDEAKSFFRPNLDQLHDPFLMKDMDKAVNRIVEALEKEEKIIVYGDYDVDGTTAISVVYSFFRQYIDENKIEFYSPDRYKEGYGISELGIQYASDNSFTLIIALDCGIQAIDEIELAKSLGVDFIICDHHLPGEKIPNAVAVLDPKRNDCPYPYKELSGCGVGFKLIQAFHQQYGGHVEDLLEYLDLVAISIASDIVEIKGENRALAFLGINQLNGTQRVGLQALFQENLKKESYKVSDLVFGIGPRINAAGRMGDAKDAVKVLVERDYHTAKDLVRKLNERNNDRKEVDTNITVEAIRETEENEHFKQKKSIVVYGSDWHKGVIGIVASRLVEKYYKPTIVFSQTEDTLTGSARSTKKFDIHSAIGACGDLVEQFGGHMFAAGLSIKKDNFSAFEERFESIVSKSIDKKDMVPEIVYDLEVALESIDKKFYDILNQMEPFGPGNMTPIFRTNNLINYKYTKVLKEKHLKFSLADKNNKFWDVIGFNLGDKINLLRNSKPIDICYAVEENVFKGKTTLQLRLLDLIASENN